MWIHRIHKVKCEQNHLPVVPDVYMMQAVSWAVGRCMFWAGFFEPICKNSTSLVTSKPCRVRQYQYCRNYPFLQRYCTTDEDRISHASLYWCGQETQWTWDSVHLATNSDCAKHALVADELIQASTKGIDSCLNLICWSIESSLKQTIVALHVFPTAKLHISLSYNKLETGSSTDQGYIVQEMHCIECHNISARSRDVACNSFPLISWLGMLKMSQEYMAYCNMQRYKFLLWLLFKYR